MSSFLAALQLLTIIPVRRSISAKKTAYAPAFFPVVGILIGAILCGLSWVLRLLLPGGLVNALIIAALVLITGALHLDGLSDTCDGLGGNRTQMERLRIMDDSHAGSFGVVGIVLVLLIEYVSLVNLPRELSYFTLIVMTTTSRWAMTYAIFNYPYVKNAGMGKTFKESISQSQMIAASIVTLVVAIGLMHIAGLAVVLFSWLVVMVIAEFLKRKLGGLTGDCYGAVNEIAELSVLLIINLLLKQNWLGIY